MTTIADAGLSMLGPLYLQAADKIRETGYAPCDDYEGEQGISICTALRLTADAYIDAAVTAGGMATNYYDLAETLETRLGAVLYLTGLVTTRRGIDISDTVNNWERRFYGDTVDQVQAVAVLRTAAALVSTITGA